MTDRSPGLVGAAWIDAAVPLDGVRVVETAGELTGYAGRLLADLGATVTRIAPVAADALGDAADQDVEWFLHRNKDEVRLDASTPDGLAELELLVRGADILIEDELGRDWMASLPAEALQHPVRVTLSPFGLEGPRAGYASTDLVRLAAGGLLWLGGYQDAEPVAPFGDQSSIATGLFGAVAAVLGLLERESGKPAPTLDVSSQEVLTQALETSIPDFELTGKLRRRLGDTPREAGTGTYPCADGYISMVAGRLGTARAWTRLREWLVAEGTPGAEELMTDDWETLPFRQRPESVQRFSEIFFSFASTRTKQELYHAAQSRGIALSPVNTLCEVLADPQLAARSFFQAATHPSTGVTAQMPSAPFRLTGAPIDPAVVPAAPVRPSEAVLVTDA